MCFVCIETLPLIRLFDWLRATWVPKDPQSQKDSGALWVGELTGRMTPALFVPLTWTAGLFYPAFASGNKWSWPRKGGGNLVVVSISACSDVLYLKSLFSFPCPWPLPSSLPILPPLFLWTSSLYSLGWAEATGLEMLNSFHWNSFSTQNQFLVFILWWFLLCCNTIIKPFQAKINGFSPPFAFEISSTSTPINHWFKGGKKMWLTGQPEISHPPLTSQYVSLARHPYINQSQSLHWVLITFLSSAKESSLRV